jgi:hypothetical protein
MCAENAQKILILRRSMLMIDRRKEFNFDLAAAHIVDETIRINFEDLSMLGILAGFAGMESKERAEVSFISDILWMLARGHTKSLQAALVETSYEIGVNMEVGWRSATAFSKGVRIGGRVYIYDCTVAAPPRSKRRNYNPRWYAGREIGKRKNFSSHSWRPVYPKNQSSE